jgi:hypothetical protein
LEKLSLFNKKISKNCRKYYIVLLVLCKVRHTPAALQPPLSRGELPCSSFSNRLLGGVPSREEAGCVKIRIAEILINYVDFIKQIV